MSRPRDVARRDDLLAAVIDTVAARGVGNRSLRDIATEVGTSHRMLLHHFGTREELLVAIVREVEAREAQLVATLDGSPSDRVTHVWAHLSDPAMRALERLFFESYSRGANGEAPFDVLLPHAVHTWLRPAGGDDAHDPALVRLGLAVIRGLLLDLVATGDQAETTRALERFVELIASASSSPLVEPAHRAAVPADHANSPTLEHPCRPPSTSPPSSPSSTPPGRRTPSPSSTATTSP